MTNQVLGLVSFRDHHFYSSLIDESSVVVDLGSHLGDFSFIVSSKFGCSCYAVEALPSLYEKIVETSLLKKFNYAICGESQTVEFCIEDNPESNHIAKLGSGGKDNIIKVQGITLEDFIRARQFQDIDLLKVDIEGAEIDLFKSVTDKTLCGIKQISIEFHDFAFEIGEEVKQIKKRLQSLGFVYIVFSITSNKDVLFINMNRCQIPLSDYIYMRFLAKYLEAGFRLINRYFKKKS